VALIRVNGEQLRGGETDAAGLSGALLEICGEAQAALSTIADAAGGVHAAGAVHGANAAVVGRMAHLADSMRTLSTNLGAAGFSYDTTDRETMPEV
jgi:hypothetical protein